MINKSLIKYTIFSFTLLLLVDSCKRNKNIWLKWSPALLHIEIKNEGLKKLHSKRNKALNEGLLVTEKDSWVKGKIIESENSKENN